MVIVETSVWINFFRDANDLETRWLRGNSEEEIGLMDLTLCEVLQGAIQPSLFTSIFQSLSRLPVHSSGGARLMLAAAENYRILRSKGVTVRSTIDCIIATYCIQNGHQLLHRDSDFDGFEKHLGLRVVRPKSLA